MNFTGDEKTAAPLMKIVLEIVSGVGETKTADGRPGGFYRF